MCAVTVQQYTSRGLHNCLKLSLLYIFRRGNEIRKAVL